MLAVVLFLLALPLRAEQWLAVDASAPFNRLDQHIDVLEDVDSSLDIHALRGAAGAAFAPLGERSTSLGYTRSAWWVRVVLRNETSEPASPTLRLAYPLLDRLDVWVFEGDSQRQFWQTGDTLAFSSRPLAHRDFLFPLDLGPGSEQVVYLRAASGGPVNLSLLLYAEPALLPALSAETLLLGALLGGIVLLGIGVLLLYLVVRDAAFLHYLCYLLSYGAYLAVFNGLAYQYIWPDSPALAGVVQVWFLMLALFFLVQFSRVILRIRQVAPRLDLGNRALQGLVLCLMLLAPFTAYADLIRPISLATLWSMAMVLAMGIAALRAGQPAAPYYLLAWSGFLVGVVAYMLKSFGWLPHNLLTHYGFQIGTVFEFVLLSVALGIRVQELRQQSRTDALTGLANRSRFDELIGEQFARQQTSGQPLALLVIDVDHFKQVNDLHGHVAGDRVLQQVAAIMGREIAGSGQACRYGGEEFAILLPRTDLAPALKVADALRAAVCAEQRDPALTISIGVACTSGQQFADPRDLFRAADEALYRAKQGGRNRVESFAPPPAHPGQLVGQPI